MPYMREDFYDLSMPESLPVFDAQEEYMELPFQIDQETCNELARRAGINALGAYVNGVDLLNAGDVRSASENLRKVRAECSRFDANEPEGVANFEAALIEAVSTGWTGDPSHWLIAEREFELESEKICEEVSSTLMELASRIKPSGVNMTSRSVFSVLDRVLDDVRTYIAPSLLREKEVRRLMNEQRKANGCDYSQIPGAKDRPGSQSCSFHFRPEGKVDPLDTTE